MITMGTLLPVYELETSTKMILPGHIHVEERERLLR